MKLPYLLLLILATAVPEVMASRKAEIFEHSVSVQDKGGSAHTALVAITLNPPD